jgi:beta-glucosidase
VSGIQLRYSIRMNRSPRFAVLPLIFLPALVGCVANQQAIVNKNTPAARAAVDEPFWWGVSTSSFQTEDASSAFKTDWDLFHEAGGLRHARGSGTRSYTEVDRDIEALKYLGVTHYRFGIEWARVEPRRGEYDESAIEHYVGLAKKLRDAGITPVVCLWHFTFPSWLTALGHPDRHGWLHPDLMQSWENYVTKMVTRLGANVTIYAPQNEPNAYALGVALGGFPPGGPSSFSLNQRIIDTEAQAFIAAAKIIRSIQPQAKIISVQNIMHWQWDFFDTFAFWYKHAQEYNVNHLDKIVDHVDYIGFNYYQREVASPLSALAQSSRRGKKVSDMGWWIDPDGLELEIAALARRYGKPLIITENGIADRTDIKRKGYLLRHLLAVRRARAAGHDVRGYFHWTLIDNFEWAHGYEPKFGLFEQTPDAKNLRPKESAELYRRLIRGNFIASHSLTQ